MALGLELIEDYRSSCLSQTIRSQRDEVMVALASVLRFVKLLIRNK